MDGKIQQIRIKQPYLEETVDEIRLCAEIHRQGQEQTLWFSAEKEYGDYLTMERSDAFLVALLPTAMREGEDLLCEGPVTKRLLYQINHYLIPMLADNLPSLHRITVRAQASEGSLPCAEAVGTGWTGGVDSMYTVMEHLSPGESHYKLTHLLITSSGAFLPWKKTEILKEQVEKARQGIAADLGGLEVVGVDSNIQELFPEDFMSVQGFRLASAVLALQKLFGVYLQSSSYSFSEFRFPDYCFSFYELAVLGFFETDNTVFYSAGGAYPRAGKLAHLADFPPAWKYLHPCIMVKGDNCGRCKKCIWAQSMLYVMDKLERFSQVFDVEEFKKKKDWYFARAVDLKDPFLVYAFARKGVNIPYVKRMRAMWKKAREEKEPDF